MNEPAQHNASVWRTAASESLIIRAARTIASVVDRRIAASPAPPRDGALVDLLDGSAFFRLLSHIGGRMLTGWQRSKAAAAYASWNAIALDRRVRLSAVTIVVAVVTHLVLTQFRAPEPTIGVRVTWMVVLIAAAAAGLASRGLAMAWTDRRLRSGDKGGRTS